QLQEEGPEPGPERRRPVDESADGLDRVGEALDVGEVAARLHGHDEAGRGLFAPPLEHRPLGQPVEGVVHLDRGELLGVPLQPAALGQARGVQHAAPVAVLPSRRADPQRHARSRTPPARAPSPGRAGPPRPNTCASAQVDRLRSHMRSRFLDLLDERVVVYDGPPATTPRGLAPPAAASGAPSSRAAPTSSRSPAPTSSPSCTSRSSGPGATSSRPTASAPSPSRSASTGSR